MTLRDIRSDDWADTPVVALLLHGYGADERDLAPLAGALGLAVPWASLRGPLDLPGGGAAWFTITTPGNPEPEPVVAATDEIWTWVDEHVGPAARVVPVGFSQGGLMATQLLRTRPERVAATVVLGGFVLGAPQPGDDRLAETRPPAFWGRGADDQVIAEPAVARTASWLPRHTDLVARVYPGLGHGIHAAEVRDVADFLAAHASAAVRS